MSSLIFRTIAPMIVAVMLVFSVFVLLRGHNEPGGGFIGGLIAASAVAIFAMASGAEAVRRSLRIAPTTFAGLGVALAALSGFVSAFFHVPFLTGLWTFMRLGENEVALSTPMMFDIGVYLAVFGTISAVALALQEEE